MGQDCRKFQQIVPFIYGPTASGKSHFAIKLAHELGAQIINADAFQLYRDLKILSASPSPDEKDRVPHCVYNFLAPDLNYTVSEYLNKLGSFLSEKSRLCNVKQIIVGGTGFYLLSLLQGISELPSPKPEARAKAKEMLSLMGGEKFYDEVKRIDPLITSKIKPQDQYRLLRAMETYLSEGIPLSKLQQAPKLIPFPHILYLPIYFNLPKTLIDQRCESRFAQMCQQGAIEEVRHLTQQPDFSPDWPIMRILGAKEILKHIQDTNTYNLEEASLASLYKTRQYAKRQLTWLRTQFLSKSFDNCLTPVMINQEYTPQELASKVQEISNQINKYFDLHFR